MVGGCSHRGRTAHGRDYSPSARDLVQPNRPAHAGASAPPPLTPTPPTAPYAPAPSRTRAHHYEFNRGGFSALETRCG